MWDADADAGPNLVIEDLWVSIQSRRGRYDLIRGLNLEIEADTTLGLLGPSGAGKTVTALSILGLPPGGRESIRKGSIRLGDLELTALREAEYRQIRGAEIGMIFQDPGAALTPLHRIGRLIGDTLQAHFDLERDEVRGRTVDLLSEVGFRNPSETSRAYVHELSGGMRQRVMTALALAAEPSVLIADEPTSALDAIAQDEILDLLESVRSRRSISILLISHDPDVIHRMTDRTLTIDRGKSSGHSTQTLSVIPRRTALRKKSLSASPSGPQPQPALELRKVSAAYPERMTGTGWRRRPADPERGDGFAVEDVSLRLMPREILGLVGESGSGKSTLARCALRTMEPSSGQVLLDGTDIATLSQRELRPLRRQISAVFQNPGSSLNPKHTVRRILEAPLAAHRLGDRRGRGSKVETVLHSVELESDVVERRPHELSGGQQQRVALARALVIEPRVLICDEPFTALDIPLRDQLTKLLIDLQDQHRLACLFIAHDLAVIRQISDRVAVMLDGRIVEAGPTPDVLNQPDHWLTQNLVATSSRAGL